MSDDDIDRPQKGSPTCLWESLSRLDRKTDTPAFRLGSLPTLTPKGGLQPALGGGINATFRCCAVDAPRPQGRGITGITYDEKC